MFVWGANLAGMAAVLSCLGLMATMLRRREARRGIGRALLAITVGAVCIILDSFRSRRDEAPARAH